MPPLLRLFLSVPLLCALSARAETTLCTEITPPTTITQAGVYCLFKDFALNLAEGAAISIKASNVVLDFNGHRVGNGAAGPTNTAAGVQSGVTGVSGSAGTPNVPAEGYRNIAIRNGSLIGFHTGIGLQGAPDSQGHLVEDMLIDRSLWAGIRLQADSSVLRRNRIIGTGTANKSYDSVSGILVNARNVVVVNNEVFNSTGLRGVAGIHIDGDAVAVLGNRVVELTDVQSERGIDAVGNVLVSDNTVLDTRGPTGQGGTYGIRFVGAKLVRNTVSIAGGSSYVGGEVSGTNY